MKIAPRPLIVLHTDSAFRRSLRDATAREYSFLPVSDWPSLGRAIGEAPPMAIVVVDPYADSPTRVAPELHALLLEFPSVAVLAAFEITPARASDLLMIGRSGVMDVIAIGHEDAPDALLQRLRDAQGRPLANLVQQILPTDMAGRNRALIDAIARVVSGGGQGTEVARVLGISRRTLHRWVRLSGLPPTRNLLAWMRVLLAAELLDDPGRTVLNVARTCGYAADTGLRRVTMKFLGRSPSSLRTRGAFAAASRHFLQHLERFRGAPPA